MIIEIFHSTGKIITRLNYHSTDTAISCNFDLSDDDNVLQYISNSGSEEFIELDYIYSDRIGTPAPSGYYSDGLYSRYWDSTTEILDKPALCNAADQADVLLLGPFETIEAINTGQDPTMYTLNAGPRLNNATQIHNTNLVDDVAPGFYVDASFSKEQSTASGDVYNYIKHNVQSNITFELKFTLDAADIIDAATVDFWANDWYLPSVDELKELIENRSHLPAGAELSNFSFYWTSHNINGVLSVYESTIVEVR